MDERFDRKKFKELILYLAERSSGDPGFASTKLNKLLFFCDFEAYRRLGKSITGATYQKLRWGPAAREFLPLQDELFNEGGARLERRWRGPFGQNVTIGLRKPDLSVFTPEEIALVDDVIADLRPFDAAGSSDYSHENSAGWNLVSEGDSIPYGTAFIATADPPTRALERGQEESARRKWHLVRP